ncbi:hypothetical protein JX266_002741 [Neoarthrinium moseri]|nr:hypothetical protein JX266_002741 [Neoarthrinium moseri]
MCKEIRASNPGVDNKGVSKLIGKMWSNLTGAEKQIWKKRQQRAKREHQMLFPGYKYDPKQPREKKEGDENEDEEQAPNTSTPSKRIVNGLKAPSMLTPMYTPSALGGINGLTKSNSSLQRAGQVTTPSRAPQQQIPQSMKHFQPSQAATMNLAQQMNQQPGNLSVLCDPGLEALARFTYSPGTNTAPAPEEMPIDPAMGGPSNVAVQETGEEAIDTTEEELQAMLEALLSPTVEEEQGEVSTAGAERDAEAVPGGQALSHAAVTLNEQNTAGTSVRVQGTSTSTQTMVTDCHSASEVVKDGNAASSDTDVSNTASQTTAGSTADTSISDQSVPSTLTTAVASEPTELDLSEFDFPMPPTASDIPRGNNLDLTLGIDDAADRAILDELLNWKPDEDLFGGFKF